MSTSRRSSLKAWTGSSSTVVTPVNAQAVPRAGPQARHEAVPHIVRAPGEAKAAHFARACCVEEADLHRLRDARIHGEIDAVGRQRGAEGPWPARFAACGRS